MTDQQRADEQEEQAVELLDLAERTFAHQMPLFVLVQYDHEADKLSYINRVRELATEQQLSVRNYDPLNNAEHGTSKLYPLLERDVESNVLSLVVSVPREKETDKPDSDFLTYINLHRDRIVHRQLHFVLFLRMNEVAPFIYGAPDLWDFRHQTFWLERELEPIDSLLWQNMDEVKQSLKLSDEDKLEIDQHIKRVRKLVDETKEKKAKASLFLDLSRWLSRNHAVAMAAEAALEGIGLLDDEPCSLLIFLEHDLGHALFRGCYFPEALLHFNNSLKASRQLDYKHMQDVTLNDISLIYKIKGEYDIALEYLEQSLELSKESGDKEGEATTLNNIALIYHATLKYEKGLEYLQQSLVIRREIDDKDAESYSLNDIGKIYNNMGDVDVALDYLTQSLAIRKEIGNKRGIAQSLNQIAVVYDAKGDFVTAMEHLRHSLFIRESIGDKVGEAVTCHNLALAFEQKGDLQQAIEYVTRSLMIKIQIDYSDAEETEKYLADLKQQLAAQTANTLDTQPLDKKTTDVLLNK